jgi:hypothetical protein
VDRPGQSPAVVIPMIDETTIFISAVFELVGLNKGGNSIGLPMISMGLLWLSCQLARLRAIFVLPSIVTHVWQRLSSRRESAQLH